MEAITEARNQRQAEAHRLIPIYGKAVQLLRALAALQPEHLH